LLEDGGINGGVAWSCLIECGRFVTRLEYHQTGIRYYTHTDFSSGVQQQRNLLGDPLGPARAWRPMRRSTLMWDGSGE
jgi:hypothetical protein